MSHPQRVLALVTLLVALGPGVAHAQEDKGQVITPENADPNEKYNLPPNFDPEFRPKSTPKSQKVSLDFNQAQLGEVVKMFSSIMKKNFIISDSINTSKTITIISPTPVTVNEAYRAFLAALQMNGLTVVQFGSFLKIVESKNAITEPMTPYDSDDRLPNEARMVTAIVPVENANPDEVREVISKFVTPDATIVPYGSSLIITENGANLRRIQRLVERLDKGDSANKVYVYKVLYAEAGEIKGKIEEIFASSGTGSAARASNSKAKAAEGESASLDVALTEIIADDRTNQLIVVSDKRSFDKIKSMIEILDVPTAVGGQIHVKFLEYANAEELAGTLSALASSSGGSSAAASSNRQNAAQRRAARQQAQQQAASAESSTVAELLSGEVQITSHAPTNSLVIVASPRDYLALESVIDLLDRPRKQVYVEAVIMEIGLDVNRNVNLGFNAGLGQDFDGIIPESAVESGLIDDTNGLILGQSNFQGIESALGGVGGAIGLLGPLVQIPGTSISLPAFALLLQATQTDKSVNILSTPAVLTMDNEEAEIVVGERIAFRRGLTAGGGGGLSNLIGQATQGTEAAGLASLIGGGGLSGLGGLIAPIEYEDVGITLRILPQVNESDYVRLEVDQEVSDVKGASGIDGAPDRTRRNIKTVVLVKDQSTVVIGGLIRDVENETVDKVPFLGDIPLIGVLFRNTGTLKTKQNLVLMLTPYIIESELDLKKIHDRKLQEREELMKVFGRRDLEYMRSVNYDKKSGLLTRMKQQIEGAQGEKAAREAALEAFQMDGPRYQLLGGDEEEPVRRQLPDGGVEFDPERVPDEPPQTPPPADGEGSDDGDDGGDSEDDE